MKIGIDVRSLYLPQLKGIGIYLNNLLDELLQLDQAYEYTLFYDSRQSVVHRKPQGNNVQERGLSISRGDTLFFWEQLQLPSVLQRNQFDLFHCPANTTFLFKNSPVVVTIHDTITQEIPYQNRIKDFYYKKLQPIALKRAERIIVPSTHSKDNVVRLLKINPEKIRIIHQGINANFKTLENPNTIEQTKQKLGIQGEYLLFTGGESPWKNVSRLIEAFTALKRKKGIEEQLIICGIRTPLILEQHKEEIKKSGLQLNNDVIILGYVDATDLIALYNGAKIFVYPSFNEGFGFPPLEAMACGAPVAVSQAASMPEIVGDAGLFFDPLSVESIAETIYRLLIDPIKRKDLQDRGWQRVKQFAWKKTALRTLEVYQELL